MSELKYVLCGIFFVFKLHALDAFSNFENITKEVFNVVNNSFEQGQGKDIAQLQKYLDVISKSLAAKRLHKLVKSNNFDDIIRYIEKDTVVFLDIDEVCRSYVMFSKGNNNNLPSGYFSKTEEVINPKLFINNKAYYLDYTGPVGEDLKRLFDHCKNVDAKIFGLTTTGKGRAENLKKYFSALGVNFTSNLAINDYYFAEDEENQDKGYGFFEGIIYCAGIHLNNAAIIKHKGAHLKLFIASNPDIFNQQKNNIVFVDDLFPNLTDVYDYTFLNNIPSVLVHYSGFDNKNSYEVIKEELKELGEYKKPLRKPLNRIIYNFCYKAFNPVHLFLLNHIKDKIGVASALDVLCSENFFDTNDISSLPHHELENYSNNLANWNKEISSIMDILRQENYFQSGDAAILPFNYRRGQPIQPQLFTHQTLTEEKNNEENLVASFFNPFFDQDNLKKVLDDIIKIYYEKNKLLKEASFKREKHSAEDLIFLYRDDLFLFILSNADALGSIEKILDQASSEMTEHEYDLLKLFFENIAHLHEQFSKRLGKSSISFDAIKETSKFETFMSSIRNGRIMPTETLIINYLKPIYQDAKDKLNSRNNQKEKLDISEVQLVHYLMSLKTFYVEFHEQPKISTPYCSALIDNLFTLPEQPIKKLIHYIKRSEFEDKEKELLVHYLNEITQLQEKLIFDSEITIPYRDSLLEAFISSPLSLLDDIKIIIKEHYDGQTEMLRHIDILKETYLELFFEHYTSGHQVVGEDNVEKIGNIKTVLLKDIHSKVKRMVNTQPKT